jgi:hypothetical protein
MDRLEMVGDGGNEVGHQGDAAGSFERLGEARPRKRFA